MIDYSQILVLNYSGKQWSLSNNDYNTLEWYGSSQKPTKEELDSQWEIVQNIINKNNCKSKAKDLIAACDWSVLPDVNLQNKSDFENYRNKLRQLIINPVENPVFPIEPDPIWSK